MRLIIGPASPAQLEQKPWPAPGPAPAQWPRVVNRAYHGALGFRSIVTRRRLCSTFPPVLHLRPPHRQETFGARPAEWRGQAQWVRCRLRSASRQDCCVLQRANSQRRAV